MLGSGMTIKFFALFFWRGLALGPATVSAVYIAGPLGVSACAILAQRASLLLGRLQVTLLCKFVGVGLLVLIGRLDLHTPHASLYILPIYLTRTWLMNCTAGLTKSVLNDYVPKKSRGKWNALESLNVFSWSGSALLGGLLIDRFGYQTTFLLTATLQGISALCLLPLLALVHAERDARGGAAGKRPFCTHSRVCVLHVSACVVRAPRCDGAWYSSGPLCAVRAHSTLN